MVARHEEARVCPIENEPGTWQTAVAEYRATSNMTTLALHSEGNWTAYFDMVSMEPIVTADGLGIDYLGCFIDGGDRDIVDDDDTMTYFAVATNMADAERECVKKALCPLPAFARSRPTAHLTCPACLLLPRVASPMSNLHARRVICRRAAAARAARGC